eukprot:2987644-Prymnesium_polylepis.1
MAAGRSSMLRIMPSLCTSTKCGSRAIISHASSSPDAQLPVRSATIAASAATSHSADAALPHDGLSSFASHAARASSSRTAAADGGGGRPTAAELSAADVCCSTESHARRAISSAGMEGSSTTRDATADTAAAAPRVGVSALASHARFASSSAEKVSHASASPVSHASASAAI